MARRLMLLSSLFCVALDGSAAGYEVRSGQTEYAIGGVVSAGAQCDRNGCRVALPLQPAMSLRIRDDHELFVKVGFAAGDGLNTDGMFNVAPWAADLQANVENINGGSRSYLLNAWYRFTADLGSSGTLQTTLGLIDSTDFLDENVYSNDEYTQFMNSALVNGPNVFLPSYDLGLALDWSAQKLSLRAVYMNIEQNGDGNPFNFAGVQLGYRVDSSLGRGNYRLLLDATDDRFRDPTGERLVRRAGVTISCDQQLGRTVGAFVRIGRQTDDAAIDYGELVSGGLDLAGEAWGRTRDNIGVGFAYLSGGNGALASTQVAEVYYRVALDQTFSVSGDAQYMTDRYLTGDSPEGFILGVRLTAEF